HTIELPLASTPVRPMSAPMHWSPSCGPVGAWCCTAGLGASEGSRLHAEPSVYCRRAQCAADPSLKVATAPRGEQGAPSPTAAGRASGVAVTGVGEDVVSAVVSGAPVVDEGDDDDEVGSDVVVGDCSG